MFETLTNLLNILFLCCLCIGALYWVPVAIQTMINLYRRERREQKKAEQDDEYQRKRMNELH